MSQIKQKDAVVNAVTQVLGSNFTAKTTVVKDVITKEQKAAVRDIVFDGIMNGDVVYNKSTEDEKVIQRYVNSMVDNHLRKSRDLNGDSSYTPEKTGVRRDPQLKELNKLASQFEEGSDEHSKIVEYIEKRNTELDELRAQKRSASSIGPIDASALPENLRQLVANAISPTETTTSEDISN